MWTDVCAGQTHPPILKSQTNVEVSKPGVSNSGPPGCPVQSVGGLWRTPHVDRTVRRSDRQRRWPLSTLMVWPAFGLSGLHLARIWDPWSKPLFLAKARAGPLFLFAKKHGDWIKVYEKMSLLLNWFIVSVKQFFVLHFFPFHKLSHCHILSTKSLSYTILVVFSSCVKSKDGYRKNADLMLQDVRPKKPQSHVSTSTSFKVYDVCESSFSFFVFAKSSKGCDVRWIMGYHTFGLELSLSTVKLGHHLNPSVWCWNPASVCWQVLLELAHIWFCLTSSQATAKVEKSLTI